MSIEGPLATVTLRRPAQANRLSPDDLAVLHAHMTLLRARPDVRLVLVCGEGAHFCAGFQIDAVGEVDATGLFQAFTDDWMRLPQITIALIQGGIWGGAADWGLACDFRLGGPAARMGIPAARLGLHFYGSGLARLVSRLGVQAAKRLLLANETWDAAEMQRMGYLDERAEADLDALRARWVDRLLALAPLAQQGMKRHLNALALGALEPAALARDMAQCAASNDLREGVQAWREGRTPHFAGR